METGRQEEFIEKLYEGILPFAKAFHPRPVVYRTTDFKTNEYRDLEGRRQVRRCRKRTRCSATAALPATSRDIDIFKLEIEAIKRVRKEYHNLWVMIPFVRTVNELRRTKEMLEAEGLKRGPDFKLWMMVEIPSNIFLIDKFIDVGIDGISIGSNDLTQLILGIDRDTEKLAGDL